MRDVERIDKVLNAVKKIWKKYPDLRLGQLIGNVVNNYNTLYYIEEPDLVNMLSRFYKIDVTETSKEEAAKEVGIQNKNRIYVHNDTEVKAIKKEELDDYLKNGYIIGRK